MFKNLTKWLHDPVGIRKASASWGSLTQVASNLIGGEQRDSHPWRALLKVKPTWRRGSQKIGDCVSFGTELAMTVLMAVQDAAGQSEFIEEAATEPIYGGCRVEYLKKRAGGFSDGAFGYAAAGWVNKYGVILRLDYSKDTKNPEHNLLKYDGSKAKQWGNFGCGGSKDNGALDGVAKEHPVGHVAQVTTIPEAIASLTNGYGFTIASMAGFGQMIRDSNGICRWVDSWAHQMYCGGLMWFKGKPLFRIFQSWGDCVRGPDPGIEDLLKGVWAPQMAFGSQYQTSSGLWLKPNLPTASFPCVADMSAATWNPISATSWWATEADMSRILSSGDCWTYADIQGFKPRKLDILGAASSWS